MQTTKILLTLIFILLIIPISAFAITINQYDVVPTTSYAGSSFKLCADITTIDLTNDVIALVTFPDINQQKYLLEAKPTKDILQSTCFASLKGDYEYSFDFSDSQLIGFYSVEFVAIDSLGQETSEPISFAVNSLPQTPVELVKEVEKITKQPNLEVFGTEYQVGDDVKTWLQLLEGDIYVDNATCYATIYKPDTSYLYQNSLMTHIEKGVYEYNFVAPNISGVFPVIAECFFMTETRMEFADAETFINGSQLAGDFTRTFASDNSYEQIKDDPVTNQHIEVIYNFSGITFSNITKLDLSMEGQLVFGGAGSGNATFYMFNFNTSQYVELPNKLTQTVDTTISNNLDTITNPAHFFTGNSSVNTTATLKIVALGNSGSDLKELWNDYMHLDLTTFVSEPVTDIKGGGEIHITSGIVEVKSLLDNIMDFLQNTIFVKLLEITGIVETNQAKLNQTLAELEDTREQIENLSQKVGNISVSTILTNISNVVIEGNVLAISKGEEIIARISELEGIDVDVLGTEYTFGDNGKIFVQLLENQLPVINASCRSDVYFPNSTDYFLFQQPMNQTANQDGFFYLDFIAPNISGVYMINTECDIEKRDIETTANSFEIKTGTLSSGTLADTFTSNDAKLTITDVSNIATIQYNFTNVTLFPVPQDMILTFEGILKHTGGGSGNIIFSAFNYSGNKFEPLFNTQLGSSGTLDSTTINTIENATLFVQDKIVQILVNGSGTGITNLQTDFIKLNYQGFNKTITVSGSGELHITPYFAQQTSLLQDIKTILNATILTKILEIIGITETNQGILNQTREQISNQTELIESINQSLTSEILATRQNISEELRDLKENFIFGEAYS